MKETYNLSLLVVDEEQLLAEKVVSILQQQNIACRMLLVDEKNELSKALRRKWDIVLYGKTYDLKINEILATINSLKLDLPVVAMLENTSTDVISSLDHSEKSVLDMLAAGVAEVHLRTHVTRVAFAISSQLKHLYLRRSVAGIKNQLAETEMRATLLLKNSRSAVAYISEGMHIYVNEVYQNLFGFEKPEEIIGVPVIDLIAGKNVSEFKDFLTSFMKGDRSNLEFVFESVRTDGSTFEAKLQLASASHEGEPCTQIIIQNNQASEEVKAQLAAAERTDALTGLGNRLAFEEDLKKARSHAIHEQSQHTLLYVNVDNIGQISASVGIEGTDGTILHITERLKTTFADSSINRISDSGFTVITFNTEKDALMQTAEALRAQIAEDLISISKRTVTTTISVGMVMITEASPDTDELFQRAHHAVDNVRQSSSSGGNGIHLYDPYANASESKTAMFETVNNALDKNMFKLLFQPIYKVSDDSTNFYEVYLRLPLPDGTEISANHFLDIAEQCNMLERLDRWVMLNATKALRNELKRDSNARLLINLSKSAIHDKGLPEFAAKLNQAIGNPSNNLTLQFTEQDVTNYLGTAIEQFDLFRQAGCHISISGFGTSPKSIDLFAHLKPKVVKLNRSYSQDLGDADNVTKTQRFVADITAANVDAVMAFIEDASSMSTAWRVGAPYLQGLYLQPPINNLGQPTEAQPSQ